MTDNLQGLKIGNDNVEFRVLYDDGKMCIVCQINTTKLVINYYSATDLREQIRNNYFSVIEETPIVLNIDAMKPDERKRFEAKKAIVKEITDIYGPTFIGLTGKFKRPEVNAILEKYDIKRNVFWRIIRLYLQSGCQLVSLADNRSQNAPSVPRPKMNYDKKVGRPAKYGLVKGVVLNDEVRERFDEFLGRYKKGREQTFKNAYIGLTEKYYS